MEGHETVVILESLLRKALEFQSLQHNGSTSSARYGGNWYPRGGNHGPKRQTQQGGTRILRRDLSSRRHVPGGNRNPRSQVRRNPYTSIGVPGETEILLHGHTGHETEAGFSVPSDFFFLTMAGEGGLVPSSSEESLSSIGELVSGIKNKIGN